MLFRLINNRYERKSLLITSNRPVSDWRQVIGDATLTTSDAGPLAAPQRQALAHPRRQLPAYGKSERRIINVN